MKTYKNITDKNEIIHLMKENGEIAFLSISFCPAFPFPF